MPKLYDVIRVNNHPTSAQVCYKISLSIFWKMRCNLDYFIQQFKLFCLYTEIDFHIILVSIFSVIYFKVGFDYEIVGSDPEAFSEMEAHFSYNFKFQPKMRKKLIKSLFYFINSAKPRNSL